MKRSENPVSDREKKQTKTRTKKEKHALSEDQLSLQYYVCNDRYCIVIFSVIHVILLLNLIN